MFEMLKMNTENYLTKESVKYIMIWNWIFYTYLGMDIMNQLMFATTLNKNHIFEIMLYMLVSTFLLGVLIVILLMSLVVVLINYIIKRMAHKVKIKYLKIPYIISLVMAGNIIITGLWIYSIANIFTVISLPICLYMTMKSAIDVSEMD